MAQFQPAYLIHPCQQQPQLGSDILSPQDKNNTEMLLLFNLASNQVCMKALLKKNPSIWHIGIYSPLICAYLKFAFSLNWILKHPWKEPTIKEIPTQSAYSWIWDKASQLKAQLYDCNKYFRAVVLSKC